MRSPQWRAHHANARAPRAHNACTRALHTNVRARIMQTRAHASRKRALITLTRAHASRKRARTSRAHHANARANARHANARAHSTRAHHATRARAHHANQPPQLETQSHIQLIESQYPPRNSECETQPLQVTACEATVANSGEPQCYINQGVDANKLRIMIGDEREVNR